MEEYLPIRKQFSDIVIAIVVAFIISAFVYIVSKHNTVSVSLPATTEIEWVSDTSWIGGWR